MLDLQRYPRIKKIISVSIFLEARNADARKRFKETKNIDF